MPNSGICAHAGCACTVEGPKAVVRGGEAYCSSGCAAGDGCGHPNCNCDTSAGTQGTASEQ